jgi:hypothetical protein
VLGNARQHHLLLSGLGPHDTLTTPSTMKTPRRNLGTPLMPQAPVLSVAKPPLAPEWLATNGDGYEAHRMAEEMAAVERQVEAAKRISATPAKTAGHSVEGPVIDLTAEPDPRLDPDPTGPPPAGSKLN